MKTKVCPCCDQPVTGMYCKGCRKIVWKPVEQDIKYFLNTRHPEFETDCSYHNDVAHDSEAANQRAVSRSRSGATTSDSSVRSANHKMTASETEAKKAEIRARMEAGKREVMKSFGAGVGAGTKKRAETNWMMPKQVQTVLNGDVIRQKKVAAGNPLEKKRHSAMVAALTAFLVVFVILFTIVMIIVINSINQTTRVFVTPEPAWETPLINTPAPIEVPAATAPAVEIEIPTVTLSPELEAFLKEQQEYQMELPTTPPTDPATKEEWELTDAEVKENGLPCNGYGHFPVLFEDVSTIFSNCILDAGYGWTIYDAFSYNQFIDEYTWYETMYEYTVQDGDENIGYINVNVDTATGEIHAVEVYSRHEDGFYEVADIALKFIEEIGMGEGLPSGIEFFDEALNAQQEEVFSFQYGLEVVAYKPEAGEEYAQYHLSVYTPGYYMIVE